MLNVSSAGKNRKLRQGGNLLNNVRNASLQTEKGCGLYGKVNPS